VLCEKAALECLDIDNPNRTQVMLMMWKTKIETYQEILEFKGDEDEISEKI